MLRGGDDAPAQDGAVLGLACAVAGLAVAGRHLKLLANPGVSCGVDPVEMALNRLPTATLTPWLFEAQGACGDALEKVWGLTAPQWSAAWLALIALSLLGVLAKGGVKTPFSRRVRSTSAVGIGKCAAKRL